MASLEQQITALKRAYKVDMKTAKESAEAHYSAHYQERIATCVKTYQTEFETVTVEYKRSLAENAALK